MMKQFIVKKEEAGKRIDAYISYKDEEFSRTAVQRLIEEEVIKDIILNNLKELR